MSNKLRKQFCIQRQNGEFIANFAFYGYIRSAEDKHKLVVDEPAAEVVKLIYTKMIEEYKGQELSETMLSALIRKVIIAPDGDVEICWRYRDELMLANQAVAR